MWPKRPPDFTIQDNYLLRWHLIPRNRWFNIYLHNIRHSDDDRALHDHPWWNVSIILKGSYNEMRFWEPVPNRPGYRILHHPRWSVIFRSALTAHRLIVKDDSNVWTLFITGPKVREWGFHCPKGWVVWTDFVNMDNTGEIGPGCGD